MSTSLFDTEKSTTDPDFSSSSFNRSVWSISNPSSILFSAERRHGLDDSKYDYELRKKEDVFEERMLDLHPRFHVSTTSNLAPIN